MFKVSHIRETGHAPWWLCFLKDQIYLFNEGNPVLTSTELF